MPVKNPAVKKNIVMKANAKKGERTGLIDKIRSR